VRGSIGSLVEVVNEILCEEFVTGTKLEHTKKNQSADNNNANEKQHDNDP